jgi:hypothetical protein
MPVQRPSLSSPPSNSRQAFEQPREQALATPAAVAHDGRQDLPRPPVKKSSSFANLFQASRKLSMPIAETGQQPKTVRRSKSFIDQLRDAASSHASSSATPPPPVPPLPALQMPAAGAPRLRSKKSLGDMLCGLPIQKGNSSKEIQLRGAAAAKVSKSSLAAARRVFDNATVVNFTNVQYQFFSKVDTDLFGKIENVERRKQYVPDHVVNKWERAEQGETMAGYDGTGHTAVAEAAQLGLDAAEYRKLPSRQKMQFAVLNYKDDADSPTMRGWGQSYFVISKKKCMDDGALHYGDTSVDGFNRKQGDYRTFPDRLKEDPYSVRLLNQSLEEGEEAPAWIEVNLKGGINLPDDIDKFVVSEQELQAMKKHMPVDEAKAHLNAVFGDKVEYK